MEVLTELETFVKEYEEKVTDALRDFIESRYIEDMTKESQNRWNAALMFVQKAVFTNNRNRLKAKNYIDNNNLKFNNTSNCNAYDIDKVNCICDIYINLCYEYEKEVSILGFEKFCGIPDKTIYDWNANGTNSSSSSTPSSDIYKKLTKEREESLSNIALSGKRNPVGVIAVLNNKCGWADNKQVIKQETIKIAPIDRSEMMQQLGVLSENNISVYLPGTDKS